MMDSCKVKVKSTMLHKRACGGGVLISLFQA